MTEIDKNVLTEVGKNQKVEVVVKRDADSGSAELDLVQVFVNMGKKKRVYAWLIIICMLIGFAAPMLMAQLSDKSESVSAIITLTYPGGALQKAPDGTSLDVNYITSSYILKKAVENTKLSVDLPLKTIEGNISIERLLTEETRQDLEVVEKVINEGTNKDFTAVTEVDYKYEGKYIITLANGFTTDPEGKNRIYLKGGELAALLNSIITSYNEYFYETYTDMKLPDNNLESISNDELDYIERLDSIVELLNSITKYCNDESREDYLDYRSKKDGMSLRDIRDCIRLIKDIDVDYLYAFVYYNSIAKDKDSMVTKYEYLLRNAQRDLDIINGNIANDNTLISEYKNDTISVTTQDQGLGQVSSVATDYYNNLILSQADNYESKASISERIANLNDKIEGFKNSYSSKAYKNEVEKELGLLAETCEKIYTLTENHITEIIESESYKNSYINYIGAQYLGTSFFSAANIKKAVIGLVVGAVLAVCIWMGDGLIEELKRGSEKNKRKEEEATA